MDDKLEENMYRENIKIAPMHLRIGAYVIDLVIVLLAISIMFSNAQLESLNKAHDTVIRVYSSQAQNMSLSSNPDNAATLMAMRKDVKDALDIMFMYMAIFALFQIIYNFFFLYRYGASLGQIIVKIKVVDKDNFDKPSLHTCMIRSVLKYMLGSVLYVGFVFAFFDRFARTLHDRINGTIVIAN